MYEIKRKSWGYARNCVGTPVKEKTSGQAETELSTIGNGAVKKIYRRGVF